MALFVLLTSLPLCATPQTAWTTRYNFGQPANTNQVVAMTLDSSGNIIIAGTSASASGDFDYSVLEYSPSGAQQWAVIYNSGPLADDQLRAMAVDSNGNVYVTGTSKTVKFTSDGLLQWVAPYGGRALAVDGNGNCHVTGFSEVDFTTVKLAPQGTNVWLRTFDYAGLPDIAQTIAVGPTGEVYVGGKVTWFCDRISCYLKLGLVKYDTEGNRLWMRDDVFSCSLSHHPATELKRIVVLDGDRIYLSGNFIGGCVGHYLTILVDSTGTVKWSFASDSAGGMTSMAVRASGEVYLTGVFSLYCRTIALNTNGTLHWQKDFASPGMTHTGNAIALDPVGNVYVAGRRPSTDPDQNPDFLILKYDNAGREQWVQRYNGPANGSDIAIGIAVAPDGAIYVAGHSANTNGGTDITLIKYVELQSIHVQTNQTVLLQFLGTPGVSYRFQATTNFSSWEDLGAAIADPLGLYQWLDTNPPVIPYKFYRTLTP